MARTNRTNPEHARPFWNRERKSARKVNRRKLRRIARQAIHHEREVPREVRTSGWLSW